MSDAELNGGVMAGSRAGGCGVMANPGAITCYCMGVRGHRLLSWLEAHPEGTLAELMEATEAGLWCRACVPDLFDLIEAWKRNRR